MKINLFLVIFSLGWLASCSIQAMEEPEEFQGRRLQIIMLTPAELHEMRQAERRCHRGFSKFFSGATLVGSCAGMIFYPESVIVPIMSGAALIVAAELQRCVRERQE